MYIPHSKQHCESELYARPKACGGRTACVLSARLLLHMLLRLGEHRGPVVHAPSARTDSCNCYNAAEETVDWGQPEHMQVTVHCMIAFSVSVTMLVRRSAVLH